MIIFNINEMDFFNFLFNLFKKLVFIFNMLFFSLKLF